MPARNAEKTLELAIRSTLAAMGPGDELIVGLHNCTDRTPEVAKRFSDKRLRVVSIRGKGGLALALNQLLKLSVNDLVSRMDADDICLPWRFKAQRSMRGNCQFVFTTAVIFFDVKPLPLLFPQYPIPLNSEDIGFLLSVSNPLVHPTLLASKAALLDLGGYRDVAGEDLDLWLRAVQAGLSFKRLWLPSILYRVSRSQLSKEPWYSSGWSESSEIRNLRETLASRFPRRRLGLLIFLELMGFPRPSSFRRAFSHRRFNSSRTSAGE